jgi:hypothetical protein
MNVDENNSRRLRVKRDFNSAWKLRLNDDEIDGNPSRQTFDLEGDDYARSNDLQEEIKSEYYLLESLVAQKEVEEAREDAIDNLVDAIVQGDVKISASSVEDVNENVDEASTFAIPIVHDGLRGVFIPETAFAKRSSEWIDYDLSDDQDQPWQAVVPHK